VSPRKLTSVRTKSSNPQRNQLCRLLHCRQIELQELWYVNLQFQAPPCSMINCDLILIFVCLCALQQNSEAFLRELCSRKNTFDVVYYSSKASEPPSTTSTLHPELLPHGGGAHVERQRARYPAAPTPALEDGTTSCEYTGKLWYISKKGIKFRETIKVHPFSDQATDVQVDCITEVHYRKKWRACATVECIVRVSDDGEPLLLTSSHVLMMPKLVPKTIQAALKQKIASTFETAAAAFLNEQPSLPI
jgi:hypothetical protein